eukprot:jgi/Hompol1/6231/HPOL_004887-RA
MQQPDAQTPLRKSRAKAVATVAPPSTKGRAKKGKKAAPEHDQTDFGGDALEDLSAANPLLVMKLQDGTVLDFDAAVSGAALAQQLAAGQRRDVVDQIRSVQTQLQALLGSIGLDL